MPQMATRTPIRTDQARLLSGFRNHEQPSGGFKSCAAFAELFSAIAKLTMTILSVRSVETSAAMRLMEAIPIRTTAMGLKKTKTLPLGFFACLEFCLQAILWILRR